jgi:hypothetical protein
VPKRTCAPAEGQQRVAARLVSPVKSGGATLLPEGAPAVLRLRRGGPSGEPVVRLESVEYQTATVAVPSSQVRIQRGAAGACLRADARLTATLGAAVPLDRR